MSERGEPSRRGTVALALAVFAFVVTIAIVVVLAAPRDDTDRAVAALAAAAVDPDTLPQTVPLRSSVGHLVVEAHMGPAAERVQLILDTGAPLVVAADVVRRHAGEAVGMTAVASVEGTIATRNVVPLPDLRIGDAAFTDVAALDGFVVDDTPLACASRDGILGANLMDGAVWQLDYAADRLTVAASTDDLPHIDDAMAIPFTRASPAAPSPIIELPAGQRSLRLVVDTGSNGWIAVNPDDLVGTGIEVAAGAPASRTLGTSASGTFESRVDWAAADLTFGELRLDSLPIATSRTLRPGWGNIGNAFLSNFIVSIDWANDVLYLDPRHTSIRPADPASVTLTWQDGSFVVGSFVEGAPGTDALELGMLVTAIDGESTSAATFDDYCERTHDALTIGSVTVDGDPPRTVRVTRVEGFYDALAR